LLAKYFLHGILFSIIYTGLMIVWAAVLVALILLGAWIGLIIGLALLFFVVGATNVILMHYLWGVTVESDLLSTFLHGLTLSLAFFVVSIPSIIVNILVPSLTTMIAIFIVYCFVDGYVAKSVSSIWQEGYVGTDEEGGGKIV